MRNYEGPERRTKKNRKTEVRAMSMRMLREGVHIDELETREKDPADLVGRVRDHVKGLIEKPEKPEKVPGAIWATGIEKISEDTHWLLPGSDIEARGKFIELFETARGELLRTILLILARAGLEQIVSEEELTAQVRQILPHKDAVRVSLRQSHILNPRYLRHHGFRITSAEDGSSRSYSLRFNQ